jgi:hypothetical protein
LHGANLEPTSDAACCYWVGHCYATGENLTDFTNPQPELAVKYLTKAALLGHQSAHYYLATLYRSNSVKPTLENAFFLEVRRSLEGNSYLKPIELAPILWFRFHLLKALEMNYPDATFCLADIKWNGYELNNEDLDENGISLASKDNLFQPNFFESIQLYQKASDLGHEDATLNLAAIFYHGYSEGSKVIIPSDKTRAFQLYSKASENGSQRAWRSLATMYYLGEGVEENKETAKEIMRVMFPTENNNLNLSVELQI